MESVVALMINQASADMVAGRYRYSLEKLKCALWRIQNGGGYTSSNQTPKTALPTLCFGSLLEVSTTCSQETDAFRLNNALFVVATGECSSQESMRFLTAVTAYSLALTLHCTTSQCGLEGPIGAQALELYRMSQMIIVTMVRMNKEDRNLRFLLMAVLNNLGLLLKQRGLHEESHQCFNRLWFMIKTHTEEDPSSFKASKKEEEIMAAFLLNAEILLYPVQSASAA